MPPIRRAMRRAIQDTDRGSHPKRMLVALLGAAALMAATALVLPPWAGGYMPQALRDESIEPMAPMEPMEPIEPMEPMEPIESIELVWLPVCVDPPPPGIPDPEVFEELEPTWELPAGRAGLVPCISLLNPRPLPPVGSRGDRPLPEQPPVLIERVEPSYPPQALFSGREGPIDVLVHIDTRGEVVEAAIVRSEADRLLEQAALTASLRFRFRPAMQGNLPVATSMVIPFRFAVD